MSESQSEAIACNVLNIEHRLRRQHARWLLRQPISAARWFRLQRHARRTGRRAMDRFARGIEFVGRLQLVNYGVIVVGVLLAIGGAAIAFGFAFFLVFQLPIVVVLEPVEGIDLPNVELGFTRISAIATLLVLLMWLLAIGKDRPPNSANKAQRKHSFLRVNRKRFEIYLTPRRAAIVVMMFGALFFNAVVGTSLQMPNGFVSALFSGLAVVATGWFAWRVAIWLMRFRALRCGPLCLNEYVAIVVAIIAVLAFPTLYGPAVQTLKSQFAWLGPLGFQCELVLRFQAGSWSAAVGYMGLVLLMTVAGWWIASDSHEWRIRRRMVQGIRVARERPADTGQVKVVDVDELQERLRQDLCNKLASSVFPTYLYQWRFWFLPAWLRRRWGICVVAMALVLPIQAIISFYVVLYEEMRVAVGHSATDLAFTLTSYLPAAGLLFIIEGAALYDGLVTSPAVTRRPVSALWCWIETQRDGLLRIPMVGLIGAPVFLLASYSAYTEDQSHILALVCVWILFSVLLRTIVVWGFFVCEIESSLSKWLRYAIKAVVCVSLPFLPGLCAMIAYIAILGAQSYQGWMLILLANVIALICYALSVLSWEKFA